MELALGILQSIWMRLAVGFTQRSRWTDLVPKWGSSLSELRPVVRVSAVGGSAASDGDALAGTCSARPTLDTTCALLPLLSWNSVTSCSILTVGDLTVDFQRVSDLQHAAFMVPFGAFVGVKIIKLKRSHCQFVSLRLSFGWNAWTWTCWTENIIWNTRSFLETVIGHLFCAHSSLICKTSISMIRYWDRTKSAWSEVELRAKRLGLLRDHPRPHTSHYSIKH